MRVLLDTLRRGLDSREAKGIEYVELRADDVVQTAIDARERGVEVISKRIESGHSARVLLNGCWGFAVADGSKNVALTIGQAAKVARSLAGGKNTGSVELADTRPVRKHAKAVAETPLDQVRTADKAAFCKRLSSYVVGTDKRMTSALSMYRDFCGKRYLVTSEGAEVETDVSMLYLYSSASGKENGSPASSRDEVAVTGCGWEHFERVEPHEVIGNRLKRKVQNEMSGAKCKRGSFPCILGPKVAGMLAHEALGHLSEADFFASGAFAGLVGKRVAPEMVTMVDSPFVKGWFGNIEVDDEGVSPRKVVVIDKGVLGEQMTNREWARKLGKKPTGNARAESYRFPPIIRMRNTYFERGDMRRDELLESIKFGYYCGDIRGGQAEANSSFQVGIQECHEILNGEIAGPVRDLAISGMAVKSLMLIDGLGKDFGFESSYCGKINQSMATSDGGPDIRLRKGAIVFGGSG